MDGENRDSVLNSIEPYVSPEMNHSLNMDFNGKEVQETIFQMSYSTASGPDGITHFFYQQFWHIVGADVISFLSSGKLLKQINFTMVSLMPKEKNLRDML